MKKRAFIVSLCLLLFFLTSCSNSSNQPSKNISSKNSTVSSNIKENPELKGQDISDITKLATPDELVYLHDGVKTTYTKKDPKFQTIIQLNNKRQTKKTDVLELFVDFNDVAKKGDFLIYNYTSINYVPVYFKLVPSPDERLENWVMNDYGSNPIQSDEKEDRSKTEIYGHLAPADELIAHFNAKLKN